MKLKEGVIIPVVLVLAVVLFTAEVGSAQETSVYEVRTNSVSTTASLYYVVSLDKKIPVKFEVEDKGGKKLAVLNDRYQPDWSVLPLNVEIAVYCMYSTPGGQKELKETFPGSLRRVGNGAAFFSREIIYTAPAQQAPASERKAKGATKALAVDQLPHWKTENIAQYLYRSRSADGKEYPVAWWAANFPPELDFGPLFEAVVHRFVGTIDVFARTVQVGHSGQVIQVEEIVTNGGAPLSQLGDVHLDANGKVVRKSNK
jgi:hypothetical protein